jgi:hypothetical protein
MSIPRRSLLPLLALLSTVPCVSCAGAGPYGFAREYAPLSDEEDVAEGAVEYDPVMSQRRKDEWLGKKVSVFGVVVDAPEDSGGKLQVLLSIRGLQDRNLCQSHEDDSCRVTVTDHEFGTIHAVTPQATDEPIRARDLLRVIGKIDEKPHPKTGNWVIVSDYTRHWPSTKYVTLSEREFMRQ